MTKKLIIQVAPFGSNTLHENTPNLPNLGKRTPYLPITPEEVAEEALRSYNAGASLCHIHARDKVSMLATPDIKVWGEVVARIREKCPIIIEAGGGIGAWVNLETWQIINASEDQMLNLLNIKPEPDMLTVNMGTFDMSIGKYGFATFRNSPPFQRAAIKGIKERGWGMELEIWDISHLYNTMSLCEEGIFDKNEVFHLDYPLGVAGGQPATAKQLMYISEEGKKMFPNAKWQALGIGKDEFPMITMAMLLGADSVRVGLEDNIYISHGELAKSNAELVEKAVRIARELDFEIATVEEAREMLHLKKK
ncbi:MAG: 3-keto-5-aminohexanoate cleavage protein [Dehalococcoidia bacterium]|nr:MAG: 3-keto-5-aminohexanoate cleavage protein [Dehalococcoidia bacterium]